MVFCSEWAPVGCVFFIGYPETQNVITNAQTTTNFNMDIQIE